MFLQSLLRIIEFTTELIPTVDKPTQKGFIFNNLDNKYQKAVISSNLHRFAAVEIIFNKYKRL